MCCWMQNPCWNRLSVDQTTVFATASLRNIKNTEAVVAAIQQKTGYTVQYSFRTRRSLSGTIFGVMHGAPMEEGALVDIGGGSTEITTFAADGPAFMESMPVGALRLHTENRRKSSCRKKPRLPRFKNGFCGSGRKSKRTNCRTMICSVPLAERLVQFCS